MADRINQIAASYNVSHGEVVRWALSDFFTAEAQRAEAGAPGFYSFLTGASALPEEKQ